MRSLRALAPASLLLALPVQAQTPDILQRLMAEPVSLFDWGLAQLDRDIERAGLRLFGSSERGARPETGTIYDWRWGRVSLYLSLQRPERERTREACAGLFDKVIRELTAGAPAGAPAAWYLRSAFQPKGHFWTSRFEDVGGKLLKVIELEVSLIAPPYAAAAGDNRRVRCSGRLDAAPEALRVDIGAGPDAAAGPPEPLGR